VIESRIVIRRVPKNPNEEADKLKGPMSVEILPGGSLFTVVPEQVYCRQTDFAPASASQPVLPDGPLRVFVPRGEMPVQSRLDPRIHYISESLLPGREYLLFLRPSPSEAALESIYQLDSGVTYYRTYEGGRGAVALPDSANPEKRYSFVMPLVEAVTTFCEAVKPASVDAKIRNLSAVRSRFDYTAWRQSVDQAVRALQASQAQTAR
jgi:hypothetical protein